jgi:hypothetical protein
VHGEEPGCLIYGETAVRTSLYVKMGYSRIFFVEKERIAVGYGTSG